MRAASPPDRKIAYGLCPRAAVGVNPKRRRKQRLKYDRSLKPQAKAISLMRR